MFADASFVVMTVCLYSPPCLSALRRRVQEADEEVLRLAALLSLLEGSPGTGYAHEGSIAQPGQHRGVSDRCGSGNDLRSHVTVHWRVHSALAGHPFTPSSSLLPPPTGHAHLPVLTVTVAVDTALAARALHGRTATVALRPCHLDCDSHPCVASFTRDLHFNPTTNNPPGSRPGPSHHYPQTHPHPHPHQAVVSVPADCLSHWGDYRLSLTARVPFDPPIDVSMVDDDEGCGGVSVVLWEGMIRMGDCGTGNGSGGGESLAGIISGSEGCRAERAMTTVLQQSTGWNGSGHVDNSLSIAIPQSASTTTTATATATAVASVSTAAAAVLDLVAASQPTPSATMSSDAALAVRHSRVPVTPASGSGSGSRSGPEASTLDPAATVEVLRVSGAPAHLALAHALSRRTVVTAMPDAGAGAGGSGRIGTNKFVPGDVFSLPAGVHETMDACARLSQELRAQCSQNGTDMGGVNSHLGPGVHQAASQGWSSEDDAEEDEDDDDGEEEDEDVQMLQKHVKQLWGLYCTVREKGC